MKATTLVGIKLRFMRKEKHFSQEQLALRANLTTSYIGMLERGLKSPTVDTLEKLSNALEVSIEELFIEPGQFSHNSQIKRFSDKLELLSDDEKFQFIESVIKMAGLFTKKNQ